MNQVSTLTIFLVATATGSGVELHELVKLM